MSKENPRHIWKVTKKCVGYIEADTAEEAMEHEDLEFNNIIWMNAELRA
jgi:hypothetical protein